MNEVAVPTGFLGKQVGRARLVESLGFQGLQEVEGCVRTEEQGEELQAVRLDVAPYELKRVVEVSTLRHNGEISVELLLFIQLFHNFRISCVPD